jgi:cysteine-rich repeat protein
VPLALAAVATVFVTLRVPALAAPLANGSFETADYAGWTLFESAGVPAEWGTWGIAAGGTTINLGDSTYDFFDGVSVVQQSPGLPITYGATDGNFVAYQLQTGPQQHRLYQDVAIDPASTNLCWDMQYNNHYSFFDGVYQYLAVHVRDLSDNVLQTLFVTTQGIDPPSIPMTPFTANISAFAGMSVRIDVEMQVQSYFFDATFDNFRIGVGPGCATSVCGNGTIESGEQCDDGNTAAGDCCSASCQYEANGSPCGSDGLACSSDVCDGAGTCTHDPSPSGTPCRPMAGVCDVAESCDGAATACPADGYATGGECRPAAGVCDAAESCDGGGPDCPADGYLSGVECRAATAGEACDVAEYCPGTGVACPADGFAPLGTPCRAEAGDCDVAEACTGTSAACPADAREPDGTGCDDGDTCTMTDSCQGGTCVGADALDCDDGNGCTSDECDPLGGCINDDAPATGCLQALKSVVLIKDDAEDDSRDKLLWKWIKGGALAQEEFADPTGSDGYALCIYAGTGQALIADAALPAGMGWSAIGDKGYKFKGSSPDGLALAVLKGGDADKSKALAKGKGATLPDPVLPLAYPVTVQLKKDGAPLCLESRFTAEHEKRNDAKQFKAKR